VVLDSDVRRNVDDERSALPLDPTVFDAHPGLAVNASIASGSLNVQWASRGFVVVAADYPGLMLADQLCSAGCGCQPSGAADYPGDILAQINALNAPTGEVAFLAGHVDMTRVAVGGSPRR
jgi:hypothetical protein